MPENTLIWTPGELFTEGKTKRIFRVNNRRDLVIVENKNDITAFDKPEFTKQFATKAEYATTTTCNVFDLLQRRGIPVAYIGKISPTAFLARKCNMIPLEVIMRRFAVGSYLNRHPDMAVPKGEWPKMFNPPKFELFLKTTNGEYVWQSKKREIIDERTQAKITVDDPLIFSTFIKSSSPDRSCSSLVWELREPKKIFNAQSIITNIGPILDQATVGHIEKVTNEVFLILEESWLKLGYHLIDFKIEFGFTADGKLIVGDVIDADSWRLWNSAGEDFSKQSFRDGLELSEVERKYLTVAELSEKFRNL